MCQDCAKLPLFGITRSTTINCDVYGLLAVYDGHKSFRSFYETAGIVKSFLLLFFIHGVWVFAFAFVVAVAFCFSRQIHLGLLYALDVSCCELGA
jgi:hypothetical protein